MKTLKHHIFEKLRVSSKYDNIGFEELIDLFRNALSSFDTRGFKDEFGREPVLMIPDNGAYNNILKYNGSYIQRFGYIEDKSEQDPLIIFIINYNGNKVNIGITNMAEFNFINKYWQNKIKEFLIDNANY